MLELFTGELLGEAAQQVIEEFLEGDEISFLCLTDGKHVAPLVPAQDHKRIGEGDTGPNTGGMGVYSTDALLDAGMTEWILRHIAEPTVRGMAEEDTPFTGVLYCGLMMTARGPQVLEFNARFGDPETQAILLRLESDLVEALEACDRWPAGGNRAALDSRRLGLRGGQLRRLSRQLQDRLAHHRPGRRRPGSRSAGLPLRHRAAGRPNVTAGGRVLGVTAAAGSLEEALARAYQAMAEIHFEGMYYRRDIGHRALKEETMSAWPSPAGTAGLEPGVVRLLEDPSRRQPASAGTALRHRRHRQRAGVCPPHLGGGTALEPAPGRPARDRQGRDALRTAGCAVRSAQQAVEIFRGLLAAPDESWDQTLRSGYATGCRRRRELYPGARSWPTRSSTASATGRNWPPWSARPDSPRDSRATCCSAQALR